MNINHKLLDTLNVLGQQRKPVERLYARMLDEQLFVAAYVKLYANDGAMTVGTDAKDVIDGMSLQRIRNIIQTLKNNEWQWKPVRRTHIPKAHGKQRPLGVPNWSEKLVQDVMRMVLEAYYEPIFQDESHGFRPNRSCHTALNQIKHVWTGVNWFVEGDIKGCFDNIDHNHLLEIIGKRIRDFRFAKLLRTMLKAGYLENWMLKPTLSGTPQGGVISPILANIFMHELDEYVTEQLKPTFDRGERRERNPEYQKLCNAIGKARRQGNYQKVDALKKLRSQVSSSDPMDSGYRRLLYIRYADDFLIGIIGSKLEAEDIKQLVGKFLSDCKLEMSEAKTTITHATTGNARFLGYDIFKHDGKHPQRHLSGRIMLGVPQDRLTKLMRRYTANGKPVHRGYLTEACIPEIVTHYDVELRGYYNYYRLAHDVSNHLNYLKFIMQTSLVKTIGCKMKTSVAKVYRKHHVTGESSGNKCIAAWLETKNGTKLVSFGDYSLKRDMTPSDKDRDPFIPMLPTRELTLRLYQTECERCGKHANQLEVHHIRRMKDVRQKVKEGSKERWHEVMAYRNRKTLVVCTQCHRHIHSTH